MSENGETNPIRLLAIAAQWQPWRSYATLHLWEALKQGDGFRSEIVQTTPVDSKVASR
jgi:3-methyladenine DNA glycosylase/8-oxoguanine DNA glycosylase